MSVSEHEVAGILGLTMLSHPEDGENGAKEKTADVSNDKKNGDEANTEKTVNEVPPTTTTQPASVVEDAKIVEEQEASASSECEPRNPTTSSSSSLMSDLDAVFDATNKTDPSSKAMEEDESEKLRTENPQENSVSREFRNTENAGASPGWLEPGTKCEFLYRDQWHVGVIDSYTSQKALVKFGSHDSPVPVDLLAEKHRVCWKLGTYTSKSHFA